MAADLGRRLVGMVVAGQQAGGFGDIGVGGNADGRLELLATLPDGIDLAQLADRPQQWMVWVVIGGQPDHCVDRAPNPWVER